MKHIVVFTLILIAANITFAQEKSFEVQISNDTVLSGNYTIVRFDIINTNGDFVAPGFNDFEIVSGPNTSSMFSMVNGQTTQKSSYTYYLLPKKEGELYIEPAYLYTESDTLETAPAIIMVLPNPEGKTIEPKMQDNNQNGFRFSFPEKPYRRERRKSTKKDKSKIKTRRL